MSDHDKVSNKRSLKKLVQVLNDTGLTKNHGEERYVTAADINNQLLFYGVIA